MDRTIDNDLNRIRQDLLKMGGQVESMIAQAQKALIDRDSDLAKEIIKSDLEIDKLEMEIDELCYSVLARYQPAAVDLRFIVAVAKINND
ncbi:MAG: phosphate uptake regulator PhoU, partial [Myxococcota bacterium]